MSLLDSTKKERLVNHWNCVFQSDINVPEEIYDSETLFNTFLSKYQKDRKYNYAENICLCLKRNNKLLLYSAEDNKVLFSDIGINTRKKFRNYINNYKFVITDFDLSKELITNCLKIDQNKKFLRYEILHSLYSGSSSNYIGDNIPFSKDNPSAYLTEDFLTQINSDQNLLFFLQYSSYLLNCFENGIIIGDMILKPKISISNYGRWYWSGNYKLQQDKKIRNRIISEIKKNKDHYVSIDFISASPVMFAKLTKSKVLKYLIKERIRKIDNIEYQSAIKDILNIYIHGNETPDKLYRHLSSKMDIAKVEKIGKFNLLKVLDGLHKETESYNKSIVDTYKQKLHYHELKRRMVNYEAGIISDNEIIKKHRIYLQGHIHDTVLALSKYVYDNTGILPIYTVHDSVNYFVSKTEDYDKFISVLRSSAKEIKNPFRIEEY